MNVKVRASDIAKFLGQELIGGDIEVTGICSFDTLTDGKLTFLSKKVLEGYNKKALILVKENKHIDAVSQNSYIKILNPRLAFAKVVNKFFVSERKPWISSTATISKQATIGENVVIGHNCVIEDNVVIGKNTIINNNVIISRNTIIGENCYIKSGSIIVEEGFGFEIDEKSPVRIPQVGRVIIHNNVEIGSLCTVARATIKDTIIFDNVKMDDHVHIAHNCIIGKNTIITAQATIAGSAMIGENCWLGPNCSIIDRVKIGNNTKIGLGAVVTKDVEDNKVVMGFQALSLRDLSKAKKILGIS